MPTAQCAASYHSYDAMHEDLEYRKTLVRAMREAGAKFEEIAEVLRERTRLAQQRQRLQSSTKQIRGHRVAHTRQDVAAGMRHQNSPYSQIAAALNVSHTAAWNLVRRAEEKAAIPAWLKGLDVRTAKVLLRAGFQSAEEVHEAISAGKVIERVKAARMRIIQDWLQAA